MNGLNALTKRLNEYKTTLIYMLSTRDPFQIWGNIQTKNDGIEKGIPCKYKSKESWSSNTLIRQNRL